MKYSTFLLLIASSSAINMSGDIKCVKNGKDDKCRTPDTGVECQCPEAPPVALVDKSMVHCVKKVNEDFCVEVDTNTQCECPEGQLAQKKEPYSFPKTISCTKVDSNGKCIVPEDGAECLSNPNK